MRTQTILVAMCGSIAILAFAYQPHLPEYAGIARVEPIHSYSFEATTLVSTTAFAETKNTDIVPQSLSTEELLGILNINAYAFDVKGSPAVVSVVVSDPDNQQAPYLTLSATLQPQIEESVRTSLNDRILVWWNDGKIVLRTKNSASTKTFPSTALWRQFPNYTKSVSTTNAAAVSSERVVLMSCLYKEQGAAGKGRTCKIEVVAVPAPPN